MESPWTEDCKPPFAFTVVVTKQQRGTRFLTGKQRFLDDVMYTILFPGSIIYLKYMQNDPHCNCLHILNGCIPFVCQVGEDYGVDWEGPHTPCASNVFVPEIQLLRPLSEQDLVALPNPHVPFSQALAVYL